MNASAALIRDLQARADKGEVQYIALFSNIINTKSVQKATTQAFNDVKNPIASQFLHGGRAPSKQMFGQENRILMGVVWSEVKLLETGARFPELATADVTCKTNKEGRPLLKIQGLDGDGKMFTRANALLWNESQEAFVFAFKTAVPQLWGTTVCEATSVFLRRRDVAQIAQAHSIALCPAFLERFYVCDKLKHSFLARNLYDIFFLAGHQRYIHIGRNPHLRASRRPWID